MKTKDYSEGSSSNASALWQFENTLFKNVSCTFSDSFFSEWMVPKSVKGERSNSAEKRECSNKVKLWKVTHFRQRLLLTYYITRENLC